MKWIENLEKYNISFNIHILQKNDSIIIPKKFHKNEAKTIYIVNGLIQILKTFTNGENVCTELLYKNHFFSKTILHCKQRTYYYYKAIAIKKTVILTIPMKELIANINKANKKYLPYHFLNYQHNSDIIEILSHRSTKKRLTQLLLIFAKQFGKLIQNNIIIPFYLSHYTIGTIIGSQRVTVNRIMNNLKKARIINYDKQQIVIYSIIRLIET